MSVGDEALDLVLGKLEGVRKSGGSWMARCPAHEDRKPSLSIKRGTEQPVILNCQAGCESRDVVVAMGLEWADICTPGEANGKASQDSEWTPYGDAVAVYDYTDEQYTLLFQVLRTAGKDFPQRVRDDSKKSGYRWNLDGVRRVIYRLPKVIEAVKAGEVIWICEGEKDCHSLEKAGVTATTNPGGADSWRDEYGAFFSGARVIIVSDADEKGRKHARAVAESLGGVATVLKLLEPARGKDISDHLDAGLTLDDLRPLGPDDPRLIELRNALVDSAGLDSLPKPKPLINGLLYYDSLAWLYGKRGSAKSFIALDMAACISIGRSWYGRKVREGRVLYIYAEGVPGLQPRVRAWEAAKNDGGKIGVMFLPKGGVGLITDAPYLGQMARELKAALVVIDTQARVTAGLDENSSKDMGLMVVAADSIREASGACVMLVHHEPRAAENLRGSTALEGAATTLLRAEKDGPNIKLTTTKQKDAAEADPITLRLTPEEPLEVRNRPPSAFIESGSDTGLDPSLTPYQQEIIKVLDGLSRTHPGISGDELSRRSGVPKQRVSDNCKRLIEKGLIANRGSARTTAYVRIRTGDLLDESAESGSSPDESGW